MASHAVVENDRRRARSGFWLLVALIRAGAGGKAILYDTLDPDSFLHMLAAKQMLADGIGPIVDHQAFASIQTAWTPYSWLAELGMLRLWNAGGYRAAIAAQAVMAAYLMAVIALSCTVLRLRGERPLSEEEDVPRGTFLQCTLATAFAAFLSLPYLSFRPVTAAIGMLATCAFLIIRDRSRGERTRAVWAIVPVTVFITNVHLSAIFVPIWMAALFAGAVWERWHHALPPDWRESERRIRRYALLLAATLVACLATPMLPGFLQSIVHYQFSDPIVSGPLVAEYQPFYRGPVGKIGLGIVLFFVGCCFVHRKQLRAGDLLWLLLSGALLLRMGRFAPMFAMVAAPYFAAVMPRLSDRILARPAVVALVGLILVIGAVRIVGAFPQSDEPLDQWVNRHGPGTPGYPCAAARYVEQNVHTANGRLINEYTWGGYLEWRLGERYQALLDGRTNLFTPDFWRTVYFAGEKDRRLMLSSVKADAAIVPLEHSVFRDSLQKLGWRSAFRDDRAEVLLPPEKQVADIKDDSAGWSGILFN